MVAGIQHDIVWETPEATFERLRPQIGAAAGTGARFIALTEMFAGGFSMNTAAIAEAPDGPSVAFLTEQARRHDVILCGSVPTHHPDYPLPVNRLVVVGPDGLRGEYAKIHPFSYSGEHEHYSPGRDFCTIEIDGVRVTFFVCYDLRFADEFWATGPETDLFVVVANWPASRRSHWQALLRARAIENQTYVLGVNRVGRSGRPESKRGLDYAGDSMLIDPLGEALATASGAETIIVGAVNPDHVAAIRAEFPFLADRR